MQDRFCIKSNRKINEDFSAGYVAACDDQNFGCEGGYMIKVYNFLKNVGVITGGDYDSDLVLIISIFIYLILFLINFFFLLF